MGRVLVLVLIVVLVVWLIRRALRPARKEANPEVRPGNPPVQGDLVACARCGVNLPRGEAREARGEMYCSDEHARLGHG